jgi:hypothetical protein
MLRERSRGDEEDIHGATRLGFPEGKAVLQKRCCTSRRCTPEARLTIGILLDARSSDRRRPFCAFLAAASAAYVCEIRCAADPQIS